MQPLASRNLHIFLIILGCMFAMWHINALWSQSVDLAHHYALVVRISEHHLFGGIPDPTLGEMNFYPRLAHLLAALAGTILGSNFLGMQLVTLLSISLLWISTLSIIATLDRRWAYLSALILGFLLLLNRVFFRLELHGYEVVGNYFFSQLVAQAVVVLALAVAMRIDFRARPLALYVFMVMLVYISTSIHLLPALLLLAVLLGVLLMSLISAIVNKHGIAKEIGSFCLFGALGMAAVLLNPAFSAMRKISENNGDLQFQSISYPLGLSTVCIVVAIISAAFIYQAFVRTDSSRLFFKYMGLYGLAQAGLCLLQLVLAKFGFGSDYAVKKYGFGLFTFLLVSIAVSLAGLYIHKKQIRDDKSFSKSTWQPQLAILLVFVVAVTIIVPFGNELDVRKVTKVERDLSDLFGSLIPPANPSENNVVIGLPGLSPQFDYMFSIALAKTERSVAIPDILVANNLDAANSYSFIVSAAESQKYATPNCTVAKRDGLVISSSSCLNERIEAANTCAGSIDFSVNGLLATNRLTGFGYGEPSGRWMGALNNSFRCSIKGRAPSHAKLVLTPFFAGGLAKQRLRISVNGVPAQSFVYTPDSAPGPIDIPIVVSPVESSLVLSFDTPDATSPKALGISEDARTLSFFVHSLEFH